MAELQDGRKEREKALRPSLSSILPSCNPAISVRHIRNQRDLPRALDRRLELALVHRAGARDPPRQDLAALRHERRDQLDVLVVDVVDLVRAELADFAAAEQCAALSLSFVAGLLVALLAAASAGSALSEWHLNLHSVETVVVHVFRLRRTAL